MSDPLASIPLSALRVFEAAARLGSFTRAAQELGISQAAVSWQVKALEKRLDQALFRRGPREVALTAAGERLARGASEAMTALRSALLDLSDTGEGLLSITTLHTLASQWLAPRLGAFQLAHPRIAVRLDTSVQVADLLRGEFDMAMRAGSGQWPGLDAHYLFPAFQTALCTPEVRDRWGLTEPERLFDAPRIGAAAEWDDFFAAAGVRAPKASAARLSGDNQVLEVASALAGHGVALGSPILFAPEISAGRLVRPFDATSSFGGHYWLVYPTDRRRTRKIAAFRDWLLEAVAADPAATPYRR